MIALARFWAVWALLRIGGICTRLAYSLLHEKPRAARFRCG